MNCHPNAIRFVKYYLTITQTRWDQVSLNWPNYCTVRLVFFFFFFFFFFSKLLGKLAVDIFTEGTLYKRSAKDLFADVYAMFFFLIFFKKNICCWNSFELPQQEYVVDTYLNCLNLSRQFKWVPTTYDFIKKNMGCSMKTKESLVCVLIGVCGVIGSNTVSYWLCFLRKCWTEMYLVIFATSESEDQPEHLYCLISFAVCLKEPFGLCADQDTNVCFVKKIIKIRFSKKCGLNCFILNVNLNYYLKHHLICSFTW